MCVYSMICRGVAVSSPSKQMTSSFHENYTLGKMISRGKYGTVYKTQYANETRAVKIIRKLDVGKRYVTSKIPDIEHELNMLETLNDHPMTIRFHDFYHDLRNVYIVTEYPGDDTLRSLVGKVDETQLFNIIQKITEFLFDLHCMDIVHRDVKPDNFLFTEKGDIKAIDFGSLVQIDEMNDVCMFKGTYQYASPEAYNGYYCKESDIWSLGILARELIMGERPRDFYDNQYHNDDFFEHETFTSMSFRAQSILSLMLEPDRNKRISSGELLNKLYMYNNIPFDRICNPSGRPDGTVF